MVRERSVSDLGVDASSIAIWPLPVSLPPASILQGPPGECSFFKIIINEWLRFQSTNLITGFKLGF